MEIRKRNSVGSQTVAGNATQQFLGGLARPLVAEENPGVASLFFRFGQKGFPSGLWSSPRYWLVYASWYNIRYVGWYYIPYIIDIYTIYTIYI